MPDDTRREELIPDEVSPQAVTAAARVLASHLQAGKGDAGTEAIYNGLVLRLNVRHAGYFLWRLLRFKATSPELASNPAMLWALPEEIAGIISAGLNTLRASVTECQFICMSVLGGSQAGLDLETLKDAYPRFVKEALEAPFLTRLVSLGVSKRYLERALDQIGLIENSVQDLLQRDLVERTEAGGLRARDRDFEWGFPPRQG